MEFSGWTLGAGILPDIYRYAVWLSVGRQVINLMR
jgi:hypothetical protein